MLLYSCLKEVQFQEDYNDFKFMFIYIFRICRQSNIQDDKGKTKIQKKICNEYNICTECPIRKFEIIGDIDHEDCYSINITRFLLGDNVNATEFYKTQYIEFRDMCLGRKCDTCKIKKTKDKYYKKFGYIECLELYIAVKLLKDV